MSRGDNKAVIGFAGAFLSDTEEALLKEGIADTVFGAVPPFGNDLDRYLKRMIFNDLSQLLGVTVEKLGYLFGTCHNKLLSS